MGNTETYDRQPGGASINSDREGAWPGGGVVPYVVDESIPESSHLRSHIQHGVNEFARNNVGVQWLPWTGEPIYYVRFRLGEEGTSPRCCRGGGGSRGVDVELPERYPRTDCGWLFAPGDQLKFTCVLHEMCHAVGLQCEAAREDGDTRHVGCGSNSMERNGSAGRKTRKCDYNSIMHYGHGTGWTSKISSESSAIAQLKSRSFSAGDINALRDMYGVATTLKPLTLHVGQWHHPCTDPRFGDIHCSCESCRPLDGGVSCGYSGKNRSGHWSCCMAECFSAGCNESHTGFWHAACWKSKCLETTSSGVCYCGSCGGGCMHKGGAAHWSCCGSVDFSGKCTHPPSLS
ncbi:zinc metalloproteinase nas-7 [Pelomyxa schiedti]|nr:zinc metalloproteinase nas-7 [Pelomyxa schiedti]